jgi:hypothetical protein
MRKRWVIALIGLLAAPLVLCGGAIGAWVWYQNSLPVYVMGEEPTQAGIATNTLRYGDDLYINGYQEWPLLSMDEPLQLSWPRQVGNAPQAGLYLLRPIGQRGTDFLVARGFMMGSDMIYRNSRVAPITLDSLAVSELVYAENKGVRPTIKRTKDPAIIRELLDTLRAAGDGQKPGPGEPEIYHVDLLSPQIPGLTNFVYVITPPDGRVFLAHRGEEDSRWLPAGPQFTAWIKAGS